MRHMQTTQSTCFSFLPDRPDLITVECSVHSSVPRPWESLAISAGPDGTAAVLILPLMSPLIQLSSPGENQATLFFFFFFNLIFCQLGSTFCFVCLSYRFSFQKHDSSLLWQLLRQCLPYPQVY